MRAVAVIPARAGSKGVLRKNARLLAGRPLVAYTIAAAIGSCVFDTIAVSTEDAEIAAIARAAGAKVVERPASLASDAALTEPVMSHALEALESEGEPAFESVWLLQPTSPLRTAEDIASASSLLKSEDVDAVVSVVPDHCFYWRSETEDCGLIVPEYDLSARPRRQDLPPRWRENGAIYGVSRAVWDMAGVRAAGRIAGYVMDADRSLEIDTEADWSIAEAMLGCGQLP